MVSQLKFPKEVNTYCPKCGHHTAHSVTVYKAGKARTMAWGSRRQERRKHGYGGQKFPELKRTAKTTKKSLVRSEEHTSELQSHSDLVCRLLLEKKKKNKKSSK